VAPYITAPEPAEFATRAAGVVGVAAIPQAGEAAANVIVAKTIASAAASITAAAGMRAGGKPGTSDNKQDRKNCRGVAQHWLDLLEILLALVSIQRSWSIGFLHRASVSGWNLATHSVIACPILLLFVHRCGLSVERRSSRMTASQPTARGFAFSIPHIDRRNAKLLFN
jgi:hypothetical protein